MAADPMTWSVALAAPFGRFFSRIREGDLARHPTGVLDRVQDRPGMTKQELRGALDVAWGTVV